MSKKELKMSEVKVGWINIYPEGETDPIIFDTEAQAIRASSLGHITTLKITWTEEK